MRIGKQRLIVVGLSLIVVAFTLAGRLVGQDRKREQTYDDLATFTEVLHLVDSSYVDPVGEAKLMEGAFRGMLASLDPHSGWLSPEEVKEVLAPARSRLPAGIETTKRGGYAYVVSVRAGSPAARAGVEAGDYIRTINGRTTREMSIFQVRHALGGSPGTSLALNLFGGREGREATFRLEPFRSSPLTVSSRPGGILLARVHYLERETVEALSKALAAPPKGTTQVLLDLRDTVGGGREEATALADLFLDGGTIVKVEQRGATPELLPATTGRAWSGPLAVLVNRLSAGAAEIAVASLKDHGRAQILGEPTFGDDSIQKLIRLPDDSAVILSVGRYMPPKGPAWGAEGIKPDVAIAAGATPRAAASDQEPVDEEEGEESEAEPGPVPQPGGPGEDLQLERALEYLARGDAAQKNAA